MFDRWRNARSEVQELNLIPIMNLMMTLIPFLLLGAAFYHIGVIPTSLPAHTPAGSAEPEKTQIVTLNLQIDPDKLLLGATASGLSEEELESLSGEIPNKNGTYDLATLQLRVEAVKREYPKSDTIIILPADGVRYQSLVDVLDTTREKLIPRPGADDPIREPLFPVTVFSRLIKETPVEPGEEGATEGSE